MLKSVYVWIIVLILTIILKGALVTSNVKFEVKNPSTLELVGQAPHASKEQVHCFVLKQLNAVEGGCSCRSSCS